MLGVLPSLKSKSVYIRCAVCLRCYEFFPSKVFQKCVHTSIARFVNDLSFTFLKVCQSRLFTMSCVLPSSKVCRSRNVYILQLRELFMM